MLKKTLVLLVLLKALPVLAVESGVTREEKLWLQPSLFTGLSWSQVAAVCPPAGPAGGICSGMLGPVDVTGYHWASYTDLIDFLQSYDAPAEPFLFSYEEAGSEWAPEILADFHPTGSEAALEYVASWSSAVPGGVVELADAFAPQGIDFWEAYEISGAASENVGVLLWRELHPQPLVDVSVTPTRNGRYNVFGTVRNALGAEACALAMASGRCVFTCGPGSLRCEGGTANWAKGDFALLDLPAQPDGSINVQVFVRGQVSTFKNVRPGEFHVAPIPSPRNEPITFTTGVASDYDTVEACFNLSADTSRLEATGSHCPGGSSLAFEATIGGDNPLNDPDCDASISIRLSQDIPVNQAFSVTTADGSTVSGYFNYDFWAEGVISDANGCMAEWGAFSEDFNP